MKCKDVMTSNPKSLNVSSSAQKAAQLMKTLDVGIIPIIDDKSKKLVGVVTDRDLCLGVVAEGKDPKTVKVSELMSKPVFSCHAEDDIHKAESLMKEHQVRRIPVIDQNDYCVGIISEGDLASKVGQPQEFYETVKEIDKPKRLMAA